MHAMKSIYVNEITIKCPEVLSGSITYLEKSTCRLNRNGDTDFRLVITQICNAVDINLTSRWCDQFFARAINFPIFHALIFPCSGMNKTIMRERRDNDNNGKYLPYNKSYNVSLLTLKKV